MKLEPTEAQRKAIIGFLSRPYPHYDPYKPDYEGWLDAFLAAANSIPEGPPVGTIARRPDGAFVAVRVLAEDLEQYWTYTCVDHSGPDDDWPDRNDADSWPVIFTPGEAVGYGPTTDGGETYDPREGEALRQAGPCQSIDPVSELKCSQTLGHEGNHGTCSGLEWPDPTAQQEPVIRGTVQDALRPDDVALLETDPMEFVRRTQQEPGESLARGLDDLAAGRVSRRDDYLEPEDPEYCGNCDGRKCMGCVFREYDHDCADDCPDCCTTARTPRVVDRLGVDERGSRWRDRDGDEYWFQNDVWIIDRISKYGPGFIRGAYSDVSSYGPYTEVLPDVG
ncbi:hypothetical protein [Mycobacteroides abscessus]|uniref:hypothetical protein n=1 Tax=Mycobacteroides abscessus TaxID=36809 RepID=UPI000C25AC14|nr:hypothetical protein [Mycobacteroides abscessus]